MPVDPNAPVRISAFRWVPDFARGQVRDLRVRWALEEIGRPYEDILRSHFTIWLILAVAVSPFMPRNTAAAGGTVRPSNVVLAPRLKLSLSM